MADTADVAPGEPAGPADLMVVLTTLSAAADAPAFAEVLVAEALAACVQVLPPMLSVYRWEGAVTCDEERQVVIKTTRGMLPRLEARVRALHPYAVPEWVVLAAGASADYLNWVRHSTSGPSA